MAWSTAAFLFVFSVVFLNILAVSPFHLKKTQEIYSDNGSVKTYRLPNNTKPEAYELHISTDIADRIFEFYGVVKINITVIEESSEITLHMHELDIKSVKLTTVHGKEIPIQSPQYDLQRDFVIFKTVNRMLKPGEIIILKIKYQGNLRSKDNCGFYRSSYEDDHYILKTR